MIEREDFGPALRLERERKGVTLAAIAERTKVSASLFAAMERNDVSRWPGGIYRRAFIRGYADAVGLDPTDLQRRFLVAFPDQGEAPPPPAPSDPPSRPPAVSAPADPTALRLTLASDERRHLAARTGALGGRMLSTAGDLAIPALVAALAAMIHGPAAFWPVFGLSAAAYLASAGLLAGASPLALLRQRRQQRPPVAAVPAPAAAPRRSREPVPIPRRLREREHRFARGRHARRV